MGSDSALLLAMVMACAGEDFGFVLFISSMVGLDDGCPSVVRKGKWRKSSAHGTHLKK